MANAHLRADYADAAAPEPTFRVVTRRIDRRWIFRNEPILEAVLTWERDPNGLSMQCG